MSGSNLWLLLWLASCGCGFFSLPARTALETANEPLPWLRSKYTQPFVSFADIHGALEDEFDPPDKCAGALPVVPLGRPVSHFLHLSDAQIHDEQAYPADEFLRTADYAVDVTVRRPSVEAYDALVLAAFLAAAAKEKSSPDSVPRCFVIHTGDLLDLSIASELKEGMNVLHAAAKTAPYRLYSVAGNHDGLVWGNLPDNRTDMRGLGVNRSEFILGHLLADPEAQRGFGFGTNEILKRVVTVDDTIADTPADACSGLSGSCRGKRRLAWWSDVGDWFGGIRKSMKRIDSLRTGRIPASQIETPQVYRRAIHVSGQGDRLGLSLGYYSWSEPIRDAEPVRGLRYIVLDTRDELLLDGSMDLVQLGWLYSQLAEALVQQQAVILFAHHGPQMMARHGGLFEKRTTRILHAMLDRFPHIVAFLYGHEHGGDLIANLDAPWRNHPGAMHLVQTGSTADYPQYGRDVTVNVLANDPTSLAARAEIAWRFVRPKADESAPNGLTLKAKLKDSHKDSEKEFRASPLLRKLGFRLSAGIVDMFGEFEEEAFACQHLRPGSAQVGLSFSTDKCPSPSQIFGHRLRKVDATRQRLGLSPVFDYCAEAPLLRRSSKAVEMFPQEISGIAVLGNRVLLAGDEISDRLWQKEVNCEGPPRAMPFPAGTPELDDIEDMAVAADGASILVVTSQSLSKKGKDKPTRQRLARIQLSEDRTAVEKVAIVEGLREHLLHHLVAHSKSLCLDRDALPALLDVEGLASWRGRLFLGLRAPLACDGKAILVSIRNGEDLFLPASPEPVFDTPLALGGYRDAGIRGLEKDDVADTLLLLMGPSGDEATVPFQVVRLERNSQLQGLSIPGLGRLEQPEAIALTTNGDLLVAEDRKNQDPFLHRFSLPRPVSQGSEKATANPKARRPVA